jgi:hypothetical protein
VVVAALAGDPFVLDLSDASAGDAPVLSAEHGQGAWNFSEESESFLAFLRVLAK